MQSTPLNAMPQGARTRAVVVGATVGLVAGCMSHLWKSLPEDTVSQIQVVTLLFAAAFAGLLSCYILPKDLKDRNSAFGIAARKGLRAGFMAVLVAGCLLSILARADAVNAATAFSETVLKGRMWITLLVSLTAILPGFLCGFLGGVVGCFMAASWIPAESVNSNSAQMSGSPKMVEWLVVGLACIGLFSPLTFIGRAPKVDPLPVVVTPESPPPFHYEAPAEIKTAKLGKIQPDFTKTIEGVADDAAVSLSPDGRLLAYCDHTLSGGSIIIFDLDDFKNVGFFAVPAFPHDCFAWSPGQKALAYTIQNGAEGRRLWILEIESKRAIELPRPRSRDTPAGNVSWWQEHEVAFFPDDEPPLVLDLETLILKPAAESAFLSKLDEATKKRWLKGPVQSIPSAKDWKLELKTVIRSGNPPSRLELTAPWQLSGENVCALSHPEFPIAIGFASLPVTEGMRMVCTPDASKIIRIHDGKAEVTFMKVTHAPDVQFEASMPNRFDEIKDDSMKQTLAAHELCAFVYAPLVNPLSGQTVGPDYERVKGLVRLLEWKDKKAIFFAVTHDQIVASTDVISTLHTCDGGNMTLWNPSDYRGWWAIANVLDGKSFDTLEMKPAWQPVSSPSLLTLEAQGSSFRVVKQVAAPRTERPQSPPFTATSPSPEPAPLFRSFDESDVKVFLVAHHAKASVEDVAGMVADYNTVVNFLDKGQILPSMIFDEETAHRQKWPKGSETVLGAMLIAGNSDFWTATYTIEFHNENTSGDWHRGKADLRMIVATRDGKLRITDQKAKVYDVTDSKTSTPKTSTPAAGAAKELKGAAISVPRPCFVTVTRAKDAPQIEFTDQISFVKGIVWHRTYRELSKDGDVLRTCRAIYTGNGGVAPDRNTARIYVHAQEWDQGFGDGLFTGVCSKSAESLVGKAFQFQFVTGGMVESQLGMVFQLQK
jgi:hypothetical protein